MKSDVSRSFWWADIHFHVTQFSIVSTSCPTWFNTLGPRQHRRRVADDIFNSIFFNENCCVLIKTSLKHARKGPIDKNPALVHIMASHRLGDKPLSEPMMVSLPTHICIARPQWVKRCIQPYCTKCLFCPSNRDECWRVSLNGNL